LSSFKGARAEPGKNWPRIISTSAKPFNKTTQTALRAATLSLTLTTRFILANELSQRRPMT